MINKVMQEIIKLNHCAKSTADLSQIWAANEVLISEFGWNNSCHSIWRRYFIFFPRLDAILSTNVPTNKQTNKQTHPYASSARPWQHRDWFPPFSRAEPAPTTCPSFWGCTQNVVPQLGAAVRGCSSAPGQGQSLVPSVWHCRVTSLEEQRLCHRRAASGSVCRVMDPEQSSPSSAKWELLDAGCQRGVPEGQEKSLGSAHLGRGGPAGSLHWQKFVASWN